MEWKIYSERTQIKSICMDDIGFFCLSFFKLFSLDLTGDKRYTMGEETKDLVRSVDDVIYVDVLMDGKFPLLFKRLRNAAIDQLTDFNRLNKI